MPPGEYNPQPETGRTLATLLREHGTVAPAETMRILAEVADALEFAHTKGLTHRALTPDSIGVDPTGAVRLTGLAVGHSGADAETMAIDPDAGFTQADADADIHALAEIGYRCLTGRPLDRSAGPLPLPPHVPPAAGHPIWLALGTQPDTRTPSASRFARLCRDAAAGMPTTAPPPRPAAMPVAPAKAPSGGMVPPSPPPPDRRRHGLLIAGVTTLVVVLVAGVLLVLWQPWRSGTDVLTDPKDDGGSQQAAGSSDPGHSASRGDPDKSKSSSASPSDGDGGSSGDGGGNGDGDGGGDDGGGTGGGDGGEDDPYSGPMPDVVGMSVQQAYEAIVTEAWIQTDVHYSSSDPTCVVHTQYPSPGTHLDENSEPSITADGSSADCGY